MDRSKLGQSLGPTDLRTDTPTYGCVVEGACTVPQSGETAVIFIFINGF